jgi:hypothetical protein
MLDEGDEILVDRYLDKDENHWISFPKLEVPKSGKCISIKTSLGASCNITAQQMIERAYILTAAIDSLEASGYRVELLACWSTAHIDDKNKVVEVTCKVKDFDQALQLENLAAVFHPATFRRLIFAMLERAGIDRQSYLDDYLGSNAYGYPASPLPVEGTIVLKTEWKSKQSPRDVIAALGVILD